MTGPDSCFASATSIHDSRAVADMVAALRELARAGRRRPQAAKCPFAAARRTMPVFAGIVLASGQARSVSANVR